MDTQLKEKILLGEIDLDFSRQDHIEFLKEVYSLYNSAVKVYNKIYDYYKGKTDAIQTYKFVTDR